MRTFGRRVHGVLEFAIILLVACAAAPAARAQESSASAPDTAAVPLKDVGDVLGAMLGRKAVRTEVIEQRAGLSITLLPSVGYNPSYGTFVGASVSIGGWLGDPKTTDLSAGSAGASYSTTGQISVQFKSDFYLPDNRWALKGDWRYLDTSQPTFGLGPQPDGTSYPMDFVLYRLHQTVYKRIKESEVYVGFGYHFDRYDEIHDERAALGEPTPYSLYSGGVPSRSQSSGVSANILIDTRDNAINAAHGLYWNASLRSYAKAIGSDQDRQSLWSDFRHYVPLSRSKRQVLGIWNYLWFTFGHAPYLDLPAIGWDTYGRSARGFLQGHIRAENLVYAEFEYRTTFTRNELWGGAAFVNLTAPSAADGSFGSFEPGYGVGLRMKFNKRTNTNLAVDAARGQDETTRLFFGLQEVF
jgi:outer membrane protein assembly factor BamA